MVGPKSMVLVTVDCLRADHCGFMGYERPTTPFLDGLANESFVFPAAIATGVPTYYSFPAIMASRYPLAHGREVLGLAPEEKTLASVLKQNGYATAFFGAGNPYLSSRFGYDSGFDTFRDFMDDTVPLPESDHTSAKRGRLGRSINRILAETSHKIPGGAAAYDEIYFQYCQSRVPPASSLDRLRRFPAADTIVDCARAWLSSRGENPFLLWLHFMDPHSPYYPTEKGLKLFGGKPLTASRAQYLNAYWNRFELGSARLRRYREEIIAMYDSGVRWVDAQVARLIEVLRQFKLWEKCIFGLTADHGEQFLEHEGRYHAPSLVEELIHVPLLLRVPGADKRIVSRDPFSLLHLAPTVLGAAELPIPSGFQGENRWKHIQDGTRWSESAISECIAGCTNPFNFEQRVGARLLVVREARYKLCLNFDTGAHSLFDLEADPREQAPLSNKDAKPERRRLLQAAFDHLQRAGARQTSQAYLRARLRDIDLITANAFAAASSRALS